MVHALSNAALSSDSICPPASLLAVGDTEGIIALKQAVPVIDPDSGKAIFVKPEDKGALVACDPDAGAIVTHRTGDSIQVASVGPCQIRAVGFQLTRGIEDLVAYFLRAHAYSDVQTHRQLVPLVHEELSDAARASVEQLVATGILTSEHNAETSVVRSSSYGIVDLRAVHILHIDRD